MIDKTYKYSEIFYSFQGEGHYTGKPTAWIRFFLCNLQCDGFGQKDPTDKSTYILPYKDFDISTIQKIEDLPVWEYGCDSSYTWAKKYRHLAHDESPQEILKQIASVMVHESNPTSLFCHPKTSQQTHFAFTGGEPMLNQPAMIAIMNAFYESGGYSEGFGPNVPMNITVETNGTKIIKDEMFTMIENYLATSEFGGSVPDELGTTEWFWSCSPKLFSTSGELAKKALKPQHVARYAEASNNGQLKYVVTGSQQSWDEVEETTELFRTAGVDWPVYIMPVGATKEEQERDIIAETAVEAMKRGYYFSGRLHCYVFGNQIGT